MAKVVEITPYSNKAAPLKAHEQTVMVKVTAPVTGKKATAPLDIVFVLDTSGSMAGDRVAKMKKAMVIAIQKMGNDDRIAIVPFSSESNETKAKLQRVITEADKKEMQAFVEGLKAEGNTNIRAGLQVAVDKLLDRRADQEGRAGIIFLMSDGAQNHGDAGKVDVSKVNVQTFGFGENHNPKLLNALAHQSHGGLFHLVTDKLDANHLAEAFAMVLGRFRDISVLNLRVTLKKQEMEMQSVKAGSYPTKQPYGGDSFTVEFGDLARQERRRIMIFLRLPEACNEEKGKTVMTVECSYRLAGDKTDTTGVQHQVTMDRATEANPGEMKPQVLMERFRRQHAAAIDQARSMAEKKDFRGAKAKLAKRLSALSDLHNNPESDGVAGFLSTELKDILDHMASQEQYDKEGKALILAALSSHARQRPTARGSIHIDALFALKRDNKYIAQARKFYDNPNTALLN
uniref:Uncharacterized protein n=1 Tax=Avena sativa TaxID=4498 RepID=A0ACD6ANR5_AVESA